MTEEQPQNDPDKDKNPPFSVPFSFRKGGKDILEDILEKKSDQQNAKKDDWQKAIKVTQEYISAALNAQRVSFLLGAGCSFPAIPTMSVMLNYFIGVVTPHSFAHLVIKDSDGKEHSLGNEDSKVLYEHFITQGYITPQNKISDKLKKDLKNNLDLPKDKNKDYERYRDEITALLQEVLTSKNNVNPYSFAHLVIKDSDGKEHSLGNEDSKVLYEHFITQGYITPQNKISDKLKKDLKNNLDLPKDKNKDYERYRDEITALLQEVLTSKNNVNPYSFAHLVIKDSDGKEHSLGNEDSKVLYEHFITQGYIIPQGKISADELKKDLKNNLDLPKDKNKDYERYRGEITAILQKFLNNNYNEIENEIENKTIEILEKQLGIKLEVTENLEDLLGWLYSAQTALEKCPDNLLKDAVKKTIKHIRKLILEFVLQKDKDSNTKKSNFKKAIDLYQQFYQKLIFRDRALPRPWIFTTNYDLFNEQAMDRLGIPYCNGLSGVIERSFNPSVFRYSLGQQLDISSRHWEPVDHFVYLCKLHGSISWQESQENTSLFRIKEIQPRESDIFQEGDTSADPAPVLIYPTPMKQSASLGSPYVDLFREFHKQIVCEQSVLFTIGYSFGDEHINNIIFQALTIPNFRLIILIDKDNFKSDVVKTLFGLNDPRIWIISDNDTQTNQGTDKQKEQKAYYFETFIKHFMPVQPKEDSIDELIKKFLKEIRKNESQHNANR